MEIIADKYVLTRKPHKCWGCTLEFPLGTAMQAVTSKDGGEIGTVYWCEKCQSFMNTLDSYYMQVGFAYGELAQDDRYPTPEVKE